MIPGNRPASARPRNHWTLLNESLVMGYRRETYPSSHEARPILNKAHESHANSPNHHDDRNEDRGTKALEKDVGQGPEILSVLVRVQLSFPDSGKIDDDNIDLQDRLTQRQSKRRRRSTERHCIAQSTWVHSYHRDWLANHRSWHFRYWYDRGKREGRGCRA